MNSYFATVEQQANPRLRGKPIAVMGSSAKRTIIVAASVEAKKFGVKTATSIEDAFELCPQLILVNGEPRKYSHVTKKFIEIFEDYTDKVEIFSIDEAFLDVTKTAHLYVSTAQGPTLNSHEQRKGGSDPLKQREAERVAPCSVGQGTTLPGEWSGAINIVREIKRRIRDEIGDYITCSAGVSYNKFLAKTGSDLQKPDGLVVILPNNAINNQQQPINSKRDVIARSETTRQSLTPQEIASQAHNDPQVLTVDEVLLNLPLSEFCGIGQRIHQRLGALGIHTTADLRNISNIIVNKEFGIATGEKLKRMAHGLDSSSVISRHDRADAKSYSHSRTLNKDVRDMSEIKKHILLLSEKVATHMRKDSMMGMEVGLWLRFKDFTGAGKSMKIIKWTHDGLEIADAAEGILKKLDIRQPVRAIGVYVGRVQRTCNVTASLLGEDTINDKILAAMDSVNGRYGENVVTRARLAGVKIKEIVSGMGRDKF
jgi:DNA polymerase-4